MKTEVGTQKGEKQIKPKLDILIKDKNRKKKEGKKDATAYLYKNLCQLSNT